MGWLYLMIAIILEVAGTVALKVSDGLNRALPTALTVGLYGASFLASALALAKLDVSIAYAVWSALGTALIATIGMLWFKEPATAMKLISIALIIAGVVIMRLSQNIG